MKFSIVTPNFNGLVGLKRCIGSVRNQVAPKAQKSEGGGQASDNPTSDLRSPISGSKSSIRVHHHIQDGGSTDGTVDWLRQYDAEVRGRRPDVSSELGSSAVAAAMADRPTSDLRPAYAFSYSSERDAGMYDAINIGWSQSDGDILSWLNHDEQYLPGTFDAVQAIFAARPEVDVVWGDYICVDHTGCAIAARREMALLGLWGDFSV